MGSLFGDQTEQAVIRSIQALRASQELERAKELAELDDWYAGGERVQKYLERFEGEGEKDYNRRQRNMSNANYLALFANKLIDGSFGGEVYRSFDGASNEQQAQLADIFEDAEMDEVYSEIGQGTVVHGDGWGMVDVDHVGERVVVHAAHTADIWYRHDPYRRSRLIELLERRWVERTSSGQDVFEYLAWGMEPEPWFQLLDDGGRPKRDADGNRERKPNELGVIPYARFKGRSIIGEIDGYSYIRDQVSLQRDLVDLLSELRLLIKYQSGSLLVVKDHDAPEVGVGPNAGLRLSPDGEAYFLQPEADIQAVMNVAREKIAMMFETGSVPAEVVQTKATDESGIALEIRFRPFSRLVGKMRRKQIIGDRQLVVLVTAATNAYLGGGFPSPEEIQPIVEYRDEVVPKDTERELDTDLRMVSGRPALMTRRTFLRRHMARFGLKTDQEVDAYLAELDQEERSGVALEQARFGGALGNLRGGL